MSAQFPCYQDCVRIVGDFSVSKYMAFREIYNNGSVDVAYAYFDRYGHTTPTNERFACIDLFRRIMNVTGVTSEVINEKLCLMCDMFARAAV